MTRCWDKDTMHSLFDLGYLSILERAHVENLYYRILTKIARIVRDLDYVPEDFEDLPKLLADKYICNFSLFQSLPDHPGHRGAVPHRAAPRLNEADPRGDFSRHLVRLGRQDRDWLYRPARREGDPAAARAARRRTVLSGRLPDRRVSGRAGELAQPVRAGERGSRPAHAREGL